MQQGVNFQNVLENVLKRKNSNSVPGICLAMESTKHIDFLNLSGGLSARTPACPPGTVRRVPIFGQVPDVWVFGTRGDGSPPLVMRINLNPPG